MIFVDIETTGIDRNKSGILSIGAVHLDSDKQFYIECAPFSGCEVQDKALEINGFSRERIEKLQKEFGITEQIAYQYFELWALNVVNDRILGGENIAGFDALLLHRAYNGTFDMSWPFRHRFVDIHSIGFFLFGESLSKDKLAEKLGLPPEAHPHNALHGAKHEKLIYQALQKKI